MISRLSDAINIQKGVVRYNRVESQADIMATKVDRVVSIVGDTPSWLVEVVDGNERWVKDGVELDNEKDITNNRYVLPMSQY